MTNPIVQTKYGPVRGVCEDGINRFLGVPYAAPPVGRLRFKAPQPHEGWTEPLDCFEYPDRCPVVDKWGGLYPEGETEAERRYAEIKKVDVGNMDLLHYGTYSEDCLKLSLWTPELGNGEGRPVLVWVHGGGFHSGCGDADWHDGTNMAKKHNAVLITINHRLNVFGYCDLREYGPEFADSPNVGMLDIIAVLRWIRDNISNFGGDPNRVLVYGESGGGMKTNVLFAMPEARGLFHSAISMSGPSKMRNRNTKAAVEYLLQNLNISPEEIEKIYDVSAENLLAAYAAVPRNLSMELSPVIDGVHITHDPGSVECAEVNPDAVYFIGTTHDDGRLFIEDYHLCDMDWDELPAQIARLGYDPEHIDEIIELCRQDPDRVPEPNDLFFTLRTELQFRGNARAVADARAAAGKPVYMYLFSRESPSRDYKAGHGSEIPFFLDNVDKAPYNHFGPEDSWSVELSAMVADYVAALARDGKPEVEGRPAWPQYDSEKRATMVFANDKAEVREDPIAGYRIAYEQYYKSPVWLV